MRRGGRTARLECESEIALFVFADLWLLVREVGCDNPCKCGVSAG